MKFFYFTIPVLLLAAIFAWTHKSSNIPFLGGVLTTHQFNARPYLRDRVLAYCESHFEQLDGDQNCANAQQSVGSSPLDIDGFPLVNTLPKELND